MDADHSSRSIQWILVGMLCGVLGGTIRQAVWLAPLAGSMVLVFWPSARAVVRLAGGLSTVAMLACIVVGVRWFNRQPYAIPTNTISLAMLASPSNLDSFARAASQVVVGVISAITPVIAWRLSGVIQWRRHRLSWLGSSSVVDAIIVAASLLVLFETSVSGMLMDTGRALDASTTTDRCIRILGSVSVWLSWVFVIIAMIAVIRHRLAIVPFLQRLPPALIVPLVYLIFYSAALVLAFRTTGALRGRYYLHYLPVLACVLLWCVDATKMQFRDGRRLVWGWVLLCIAMAYGVSHLQVRFARIRASLDAINHLVSQHIPRDRIMSVWSIDGWEQIERAGYINDRRIRVPPDAFQKLKPDGYPRDLFMRRQFAALTPEYIVTDDPDRHPGDGTKFPTFPYTSWWPPFHREIAIRHQTPTAEDTP